MNELPEVPKLVKPWDMLNPNKGRISDEKQKERMDICLSCPFLMKITKTCRKCGCFMSAKTQLSDASCPEGKWHAVSI